LGVNYYRLKMVDNDGKFEYSTIKTAFIKGDKTSLKIYPNPTSDETLLSISSPNEAAAIIQLSNPSGQVIKVLSPKLNVGENNIRLDMTNLPAGLYFMSLKVPNEAFSMKIVKN
jgi:Secretion system C-terminal sorting domain